MRESGSSRVVEFRSPLGPWLARFVQQKRGCGYRYRAEADRLVEFDRFLSERGLHAAMLPKGLVEEWAGKRLHEQARTHRSRISIVRQFALFASGHGLAAFVPSSRDLPIDRSGFAPYIFSAAEVRGLLTAVDQLPVRPMAPRRHLVMREVFRLLYLCGLRLGEVLSLRVEDVNLPAGILTVRQGKFRKDRLVPLAGSMRRRLQDYAHALGDRPGLAPFFPAPDGGRYSHGAVYAVFRDLLWRCRIGHRGKGKGPRLHDLRHTYAVHRLQKWYQGGEDLTVKLPILAAFMGHRNLAGTQRYLRVTAELLPEVTSRLELAFGHAIPERVDQR